MPVHRAAVMAAMTMLIVRSLPPVPQLTCASAGYVARHGLPATLDELAEHRCIDFTGRLLALEFSIDGRIETHSLPASLAVNNGESYVAACEAGLGIVQVPRYHVERQLAAGSLVELLPQHPPPALPMTVLYLHHRHLTPRLWVFIDWLVMLFG
ncbi:type 2 periplasmic-binding domain-containing protein [Azotobacter armeniacus]